MQQQNKQPLYKVLNEGRLNAPFIAKGDKIFIDNCLNSTATFHSYKDGDAYIIEISEQQAEANAQYTALAVNNLHHLAEALEEVKNTVLLLEQTEDFTETQISALYNEMFHACREALNRIS